MLDLIFTLQFPYNWIC